MRLIELAVILAVSFVQAPVASPYAPPPRSPLRPFDGRRTPVQRQRKWNCLTGLRRDSKIRAPGTDGAASRQYRRGEKTAHGNAT